MSELIEPSDSIASPPRATLEAILRSAVERGASDIHLKVDRGPVVRFDGGLEPLAGFAPLGSHDLERFANEVGASSPARLAKFERPASSIPPFTSATCRASG